MPQGLRRVEPFRRQEVAPRRPLADGGHDIGRDHGRDQAEPNFGQAEAGRLGRDGDVAASDQPDAAAEGRALDPRHGRLGQEVQHPHQLRQSAGIAQVLGVAVTGHPLHPAEIGAGGKALAFRPQHDRPDLVVVAQPAQNVGQVGDHGIVEGVMDLGPVQGDGCDASSRIRSECGCYPSLLPPRSSPITSGTRRTSAAGSGR